VCVNDGIGIDYVTTTCPKKICTSACDQITMPDSFFASSKPRKRKRSASDGPKQTTKTPASKSSAKPSQSRPSLAKGAGAAKKTRRSGAADEELDSDRTNDDGAEIDDLELRPPTDEETSGDEFQDETPAEKRLRLAKLYLESVKEDLGAHAFLTSYVNLCSGDFS
jgi:ribosomal RNA-processing protein 9